MRSLVLFLALFLQTTPLAPPAPSNAVTVIHKVTLTWETFPTSTASNPGTYSVYRAIRFGDYCTGSTFTYFSQVPQNYQTYNPTPTNAVLVAIPPSLSDVAVAAGASYCYQLKFLQANFTSEVSDAISVTVPAQ